MESPREAEIGDAVWCDQWPLHATELLLKGDSRTDDSFPGCQFRIPMYNNRFKVAVNVQVTGKTPTKRNGAYWFRCKVEFVGDGEPSQFSGGWIILHQ